MRKVSKVARLAREPRSGRGRPAEWVSLLGVARRLRAVPPPQLGAAALASGAARVCERLQERAGRGGRRRGLVRLAWAALAVLLLLAVSAAGTALAAEGSLPGQPLYPLKRAGERVRLSLTRESQARADLQIVLAERRLDEVEAVCMVGDCLPGMVEDLDAAVEAAEAAVEGLVPGRRGPALEKMVALTLRQQEVLTGVLARAPAAARPGLERALERSRRGHARARESLEKERGNPGKEEVPSAPGRSPKPTKEPHGAPNSPGKGPQRP